MQTLANDATADQLLDYLASEHEREAACVAAEIDWSGLTW